jgi:hypothetical protein
MLLSCCPKNSQDAVVITTLKAVQDAEKNHPTKTKYKDLFPSAARCVQDTEWWQEQFMAFLTRAVANPAFLDTLLAWRDSIGG